MLVVLRTRCSPPCGWLALLSRLRTLSSNIRLSGQRLASTLPMIVVGLGEWPELQSGTLLVGLTVSMALVPEWILEGIPFGSACMTASLAGILSQSKEASL